MFQAIQALPPEIAETFRSYRADHDSRMAFSNDGKHALVWQCCEHPEKAGGKQPYFGVIRLHKIADFCHEIKP